MTQAKRVSLVLINGHVDAVYRYRLDATKDVEEFMASMGVAYRVTDAFWPTWHSTEGTRILVTVESKLLRHTARLQRLPAARHYWTPTAGCYYRKRRE